VAFFFGQPRCPAREASIPHPGMADTYGCPLFSQNKHTRVQKPYSTLPPQFHRQITSVVEASFPPPKIKKC